MEWGDILRLCQDFIPHQSYPSRFSIYWWVLPELITILAANQWFSNSIISFGFVSEYSTISFFLFYQWVTDLYHEFTFYSKSYNPLPYFFLLMLKLSQTWPNRAPSKWLLCSLDTTPSFLEYFHIWGHNKILQIYLVYPLP